MVVRELIALMGVKTDKKGFDQAEQGMGKLLKAAKVAAVAFANLAVIKGIKDTITEVAELGDRFDKLSKRTGISTGQLQQLEHAAQLSGASLNDVETSLRRLQAAQVDADSGLKTYTREFQRLGIEIKDSNGNFKETPQLLIEIADGMKGLESDAERTAVATKLLGRSGTALIPMFKEGSGALREMMAEMESLGGLIDDEMIKASADFVDGQRRMNVMLQSMKVALSRELLPLINDAVSGIIDWWKANGAWIRQDIIRPIGKFIRIIGKAISVVARIVGWIIKFVRNLHPGIKTLIVFVGVMANFKKIMTLLLSPMGKLVLGIAFLILLFEDLMVFAEGGDSLFGRFVKTIEEFLGLPIEEDVREIIKWFGKLVDEPEAAIEQLVNGIMTLGEAVRYFFVEFIPDAVRNGLIAAFGDDSIETIDTFIDYVKAVFGFLWDVMSWPFKQIAILIGEIFGNSIATNLKNLSIEVDEFLARMKRNIQIFVEGARTFLSSIPGVGRIFADNSVFGGQTVAGGQPRNTQINNSPNTNVQVSVNAAPGMDVNQLAAKTGEMTGGAIGKQLRASLQAITPSVSGGAG